MAFTWKKAALAAACLAGFGSAAVAQDMSAGKQEYDAACAICHGESGKGMGPMAPLLNIDVPDLTHLAAKNEGEFPYLQVFLVVDGRSGVRGHGETMPIWGERFSISAEEDFGVYGAEIVTRGRITVLVDYIESLQE